MSGYLDAAVMGVCITQPEVKTSKAGKPFCRFLLAIGEGDSRQFCWVCAFGEDATRVGAQLEKSGRAYAEGQLSGEIYMRDGRPTISLSIAARRVEVLNQIGRNRPRSGKSDRRTQQSASGQHGRPKDRYQPEFDDTSPFM